MEQNQQSPLTLKMQLLVASIFFSLMSLLFLFYSWLAIKEWIQYESRSQYIILDSNYKNLPAQDIQQAQSFSAKMRSGTPEAPQDFVGKALLTTFSFTPEDLTSGKVQQNFFDFFSEDVAVKLYEENFKNRSLAKIVNTQQAIAQARLLGDMEYEGVAIIDYISKSGRYSSVKASAYKFKGQMMIDVQGKKNLTQLLRFEVIVQRAFVQDKILGYQIVLLKMEDMQ